MAKLWHLRLGHLPFKQLHFLFPKLVNKEAGQEIICTSFPLAKQTRTVYPRSVIKTEEAFQSLHIDLWGPLKHPSRLKCSMFITIVDDFTRFTWVIFIKHKSDFCHISSIFIKWFTLNLIKESKVLEVIMQKS